MVHSGGGGGDWFEETMARAFAEGRRVLRPDGIGAVIQQVAVIGAVGGEVLPDIQRPRLGSSAGAPTVPPSLTQFHSRSLRSATVAMARRNSAGKSPPMRSTS